MGVLSCSEVDVFKACMAWVKAKSKQSAVTKPIVDKYLGDLYYSIRFASMTIQEFCQLSTEYNDVLSSDYETITKMIAMPGYTPEKFNSTPRIPKWNR